MLERNRTMTISILVGAIVGWFIGVAQLIIMGSWEMFYWVGMPMMPLYSAGGWALYGMILGGGMASKRSMSGDQTESAGRPARSRAA